MLIKKKDTINNHPNTLWANRDCLQQIWTYGHHSHLWAMYKMKKWPGYQGKKSVKPEPSLFIFSLQGSHLPSRKYDEYKTALHRASWMGARIRFQKVLTEHLSLSPTAFLNQFHWLQRSFEEKRRTFEMCVKTTTERAYLAAFLAHRLGKYYPVNESQRLSIQQLSPLFNRRS